MSSCGSVLHDGFIRSVERFPTRPAVEVDGRKLSYIELHDRAAAIASAVTGFADGGPPVVGVLAYRSPTAYAGILGALLTGRAYVPLNPTFPAERTRRMLERVACRSFVIDAAGTKLLDLIDQICHPSLLILPDNDDVRELRRRWSQHTVLGAADLSRMPSATPRPGSHNRTGAAYVLFTSGTTGMPKGVTISHRSAVWFVDAMARRYGITEDDRFSQNSDHTFDASVFDMFVAWEKGACVCCPSKAQLMQPARFIQESNLTIWKSVPSLPLLMKRLGLLRAGAFPALRWSLFGGEPLPVRIAEAWLESAPNSTLESTYGPTEVTVSCAAYRWDSDDARALGQSAVVPIGFPLEGCTTVVADEQLREVPTGACGELLVSGRQLALGYWDDPDRTASSFVVPPGRDELFYRTGDRVRRPEEGQPLVFVGRLDHQVKIRGFRVELAEIEVELREAGDACAAVAVPWPETDSGASGIEAFVSGTSADPTTLRRRLAQRLPEYMVPRKIHIIEDLPLTPSGKLDRATLKRALEKA